MTNIDLIAAIRDLPVRDSARLKDALMGTLSRLSGGEPLARGAFNWSQPPDHKTSWFHSIVSPLSLNRFTRV